MDEKQFYDEFGMRLTILRKRCNLTQSDIAKHLGITYQQYARYEKGTGRLPVDRLYSLRHFLNIPYAQFFDECN